jgi:hypothetical protein
VLGQASRGIRSGSHIQAGVADGGTEQVAAVEGGDGSRVHGGAAAADALALLCGLVEEWSARDEKLGRRSGLLRRARVQHRSCRTERCAWAGTAKHS